MWKNPLLFLFKKKSPLHRFDRSQLRRPSNSCQQWETKGLRISLFFISRSSSLNEKRKSLKSINNANSMKWKQRGTLSRHCARWMEEFRGGKVLSRVRPTSKKNAVVVFSGRAFRSNFVIDLKPISPRPEPTDTFLARKGETKRSVSSSFRNEMYTYL